MLQIALVVLGLLATSRALAYVQSAARVADLYRPANRTWWMGFLMMMAGLLATSGTAARAQNGASEPDAMGIPPGASAASQPLKNAAARKPPVQGAASGAQGAGRSATPSAGSAGTGEVLQALQSDTDAVAPYVKAAWDGFQHGDPHPARDALPHVRGSLLEPWVAYWALQPTLLRMTESDFEAFASAYPDTYVVSLLRDEWLRELGRRQDWDDFATVYAQAKTARDVDVQVQCYDLQRQFATEGVDTSAQVLKLWASQKGGGAGCNSAAHALLTAGKISQQQLWARLREFFDNGEFAAALSFAPNLPIGAWRGINIAAHDPGRIVLEAVHHGIPREPMRREFLQLALLRLAQQDPAQAMQVLPDLSGLPSADRAAVAYGAARSGALRLLPDAALWFTQARDMDAHYRPGDGTVEWMVRAALRSQDWKLVERATREFSSKEGQRPDWTYWHATAQRELGHPIEATALYAQIASPWSYYGQLATEALGMKISLPASLPPPPAREVREQADNPGLRRALALFSLKIFSPSVREWNFALHGMNNDQLHAAAQLACDDKVWLLCIDTSERITGGVDWTQRYVTPYRDAIAQASKSSGVGQAFLYGLIRQESRFISDIRSWVGANGLMQLMPATARWVARKIGLSSYTFEHITQVNTNVTLGSAYLDMLLQRFDGSEAMAAAGYNAGPLRPAQWRTMGGADPLGLSGAVFAENIPIPETRDYVKRVLANATVYAALLTGQPQSLKSRLGNIQPSAQQQASASSFLP